MKKGGQGIRRVSRADVWVMDKLVKMRIFRAITDIKKGEFVYFYRGEVYPLRDNKKKGERCIHSKMKKATSYSY